jgi:tetratricopeptide (TPR) repeat protein
LTSSHARARFSWRRVSSIALVAFLALIAVPAHGQHPPSLPPPPPPPPATQAPPPSTGESSSKNPTNGQGVTPPPQGSGDAEQPPAFNPLEAEKDIEVGQFYLHKGKYDAAIDRFMDATRVEPTYALPWQLMGQAYEKKGDLGESIKAYQKYLKLYPHSPERKKLEDHIAELQKKQQEEAQKHPAK